MIPILINIDYKSFRRIFMMHLFRNTYIALDAHIDLNIDRIVISKDNGFPLLQALYSVTTGDLITYGTSITDVLERSKSPSILSLLNMCLNKNEQNEGLRVVIYCDNDSYYTLTAYWHKLIFLDIDADSSYNILETNLATFGISGGKDHSPNPERYASAIPTKSDYAAIFNDTLIDLSEIPIFLEKLSNFKSIEYMIANYLYNGSHIEQLKSPMKLFISKIVHSWFNDLWRNVTSAGALRASVRASLGLSSGGIDNVLAFSTDPLYDHGFRKICQQSYLDLSVLSTAEQVDTLEILNKLTYIFTTDIEQEILTPENRESIPRLSKLNRYYIMLTNSPDRLSDADVIEIVNLELYSYFFGYNFGSLPSKYTVNTFMLEYFYDIVRNNQKELLLPYILR